MDHENYFKDVFESIPDYRKIVILLFLIKNDTHVIRECEFLKNHNNRSNKEFKNFLIEQNEEYLGYIKNQEESLIEKILNK